jgi:amino acid transporter
MRTALEMHISMILLPITLAAFALTIGWVMPAALPLAMLLGAVVMFVGYCGVRLIAKLLS